MTRWITLYGPRRDAGMSTAEYAVGTIAAAGLAALLYQVLTSDTVAGLLRGLVERAFSGPV
ncbi:DUF4244 domain-containing protein [Streptomyces carpaticus]|uniref:Uncharacterized protein n=2 Tax=Streptomyces TaxID=1883 RepID=A0A1I6TD91_9ACTN|nr:MULTISPECIES: DUF4244 domain-containing protein [Streptomyces]MCK1817203.1 DUF4244 domain-containing protein [Streptomyces sp. XM4011]QKV69546.1 DUF4244 domain-containing protein [Streptomyces harbinensis]UWM49946.1 DUF4244 domain-containing protein [Streptomyces carpaticus]SFS87146.1 Protein of unknown function [Streptomyces harbinensis]